MKSRKNKAEGENKARPNHFYALSTLISVTIVAILITAAVSVVATLGVSNTIYGDLPQREEMYATLTEADSIIKQNYIGEQDSDKAIKNALDGFIKSLSTGKNLYMSADEYDEYLRKNKGISPTTGENVKTVEYDTMSTVGYIRFDDILDCSAEEFALALDDLKVKNITGLVLDVRNVDSANIDAAVKIIDRIVPIGVEGTKTIATVEMRDGKTKEFPADSDSLNMNVAVLVNSRTSGAGELIACDIRDFSKGSIVGTKTAGNGMYSEIFELSDSSAILLSVGKIKPYMSDPFDNVGVEPDIEVKSADDKKKSNSFKDDPTFLKGFASLLK